MERRRKWSVGRAYGKCRGTHSAKADCGADGAVLRTSQKLGRRGWQRSPGYNLAGSLALVVWTQFGTDATSDAEVALEAGALPQHDPWQDNRAFRW